jgi:hypothetical protein
VLAARCITRDAAAAVDADPVTLETSRESRDDVKLALWLFAFPDDSMFERRYDGICCVSLRSAELGGETSAPPPAGGSWCNVLPLLLLLELLIAPVERIAPPQPF